MSEHESAERFSFVEGVYLQKTAPMSARLTTSAIAALKRYAAQHNTTPAHAARTVLVRFLRKQSAVPVEDNRVQDADA